MIKARGNSGTRIVFSCTWKEKKKNEIEEVSMERSTRENRGPGSVVDASPPWPLSPSALIDEAAAFKLSEVVEGTGSSLTLKLNPVFNRPITPGANPAAVRSVESFTSVPGPAMLRHLSTTFEKHQKLATLSSKRPREKGNILVMGSRIALGEVNGGRNGKKRRANDPTVTAPSCTNNLPLHGVVWR